MKTDFFQKVNYFFGVGGRGYVLDGNWLTTVFFSFDSHFYAGIMPALAIIAQ